MDPVKEVIIELRQKRGSYRAIAALLTQHCLHTSKSAIAQYCHEVLGERVRPKRRTSPDSPRDTPRPALGTPARHNQDTASPAPKR